MLGVTAGSENVLLSRRNETVYAVGGTCPHAGGPLAEGAHHDSSVICPWHKARFCLRTGALLDPPAVDALPRFAVRVAGGRVLVSTPAMQGKASQAKPIRTGDNRCFVIVGAGAAGALAAQTLREADFGGRIVMLDRDNRAPYDRTLLSLQNLGAKVHQVTLREDGIDTDELRALLESGVRPKLAHIIPNYQNPAGITLSEPKRRDLLALAVEYGFTIFEDDPYVDIRFRGDALPSMLSIDSDNVVVHASSFTKTVCPGVRVGYLVGPAALIDAIAKKATNLYISPGMVSEAIVHQFCISGDIERSVRTVSTALAERASVLADSLRKHIPGATFTEPDGGYFLWVDLPEDVDVDKLFPAAMKKGVAIVKGTDFLLDGGKSSVRLAFSAVTVDQIDEGVRRLAAAIDEVRA